jgi:hypothetical protein
MCESRQQKYKRSIANVNEIGAQINILHLIEKMQKQHKQNCHAFEYQ